ncbi:hypothetical protein HCN44_006350 [Aphidius gifuensis]|uniref:Uncharacterized protein n=1 Tax=Aphidius gifuensis TaxID=684658 RepID=A0A835CUF3_APHGI|nr:hypothetical protein HCN44_006350 [Aphidius gifuensis]
MKISDIMKTLEEKISQINNLEIIVKQFENQERSSQEQRTRLERRIAQLELEKNYQNNNRKKNNKKNIENFYKWLIEPSKKFTNVIPLLTCDNELDFHIYKVDSKRGRRLISCKKYYL